MKYYKNKKKDLFVNPILANHKDLTEINEEEFNALVLEKNTPTEQEEKDAFNVSVYAKIEAIELTQIRPLRELFADSTNTYAKDILVESNAEIEALRASIK